MSVPAWQAHLRPALLELPVFDPRPLAVPVRARLHANELAEPWPSDVCDALARVVREVPLNRYPDTSGRALRALLAEQHDCDADRIVLGNGSGEVIAMLLTALSGGADPGAVVLPEPTFPMYAHNARVLGLPLRRVPLTPAFQLDEAAMRRALPGAALCFLARPNNPTGSCFDGETILRLVAEFPAVVFVLDTAYAPYCTAPPLWRPDGPDNLVLMPTLSKLGLAAIRVGYAIAAPPLARALNAVRQPYNVSATSLAIATAVLTRFGPVQEAMIRSTVARRTRLSALLAGIPGATVFPAHGNLVLARVGEASHLARSLAAHGVRVQDVSAAQGLDGCIRASVGTDAELDALAEALAAVVQGGRAP